VTPLACVPGSRYRITGWVRSVVPLTVNLAIDWFDSVGGYLTTSASAQALAAGAWEFRDFTAEAPAGAASFIYGPTITGSPANGTLLYVDDIDAVSPITTIDQDVWPPRVQITVAGLTPGDDVVIYREVDGARTPVRGGTATNVTDFAFLTIDAELPFGVPVRWIAVVNDDTGSPTVAETYTLPGGKVALTDAITGTAAEVVVLAWPEWSYDMDASVFRVQDSDDEGQPRTRNIVVSGGVGQFTATIEFYVETASAKRSVLTLLASATQNIMQIRQPGGYDDTDAYVALLGHRMRRYSGDGSDARRVHVLEVAQVDGWSDDLTAAGWTLGDLADVYAGLTLADLANDFSTLLALAQADLSS
jgi:hypothetical protein